MDTIFCINQTKCDRRLKIIKNFRRCSQINKIKVEYRQNKDKEQIQQIKGSKRSLDEVKFQFLKKKQQMRNFCIIIIMSNTMKQIVNLLTGFVDRTLVPLLQTKTPENIRVLEQWARLKSFLNQSDNVQIWKVENYMSEISVANIGNQYRRVSYDSYQKPTGGEQKRTFSSLLDEGAWKYRGSEGYGIDNDRKQSFQVSSLKSEGETVKGKVQQGINIQSFQNLLSSFRKLCTNFQNNHKKLVRDRQSYAT